MAASTMRAPWSSSRTVSGAGRDGGLVGRVDDAQDGGRRRPAGAGRGGPPSPSPPPPRRSRPGRAGRATKGQVRISSFDLQGEGCVQVVAAGGDAGDLHRPGAGGAVTSATKWPGPSRRGVVVARRDGGEVARRPAPRRRRRRRRWRAARSARAPRGRRRPAPSGPGDGDAVDRRLPGGDRHQARWRPGHQVDGELQRVRPPPTARAPATGRGG